MVLFSWIIDTENIDFQDHVAALPWARQLQTRRHTPMAHDPRYARKAVGDIAPKLAELTDDVLFGDIWTRPGLTPRERSIATLAALTALDRVEQLPFHIQRARDNGLAVAELAELFTHLAFYAGWPCAFSAVARLREACHGATP
jgi:4-carboxymuconolactone decarboxylase